MAELRGWPMPASDRVIWNGVITDSDCGKNHKSAKKALGDPKMPDSECIQRCVRERRLKYALLFTHKVYEITNQNAAGLEQSAGASVMLRGRLEQNRLTAVAIQVAGPPAINFFTGYLERLSHESMSIRQDNGILIDTLVPEDTPVSANSISAQLGFGDRVLIVCQTTHRVLDYPQRRYQTLRLVGIKRLRLSSTDELNQIYRSRGWAQQGNLLKIPEQAAQVRRVMQSEVLANSGASPSMLENARAVNLDFRSQMPNFIAEEVAKVYSSDPMDSPRWKYEYAFESEITVRNGSEGRQNLRKNGEPWTEALLPDYVAYGGFGAGILGLFDRRCPTTLTNGGPAAIGGKAYLAYQVSSPADGCFSIRAGYQTYRPAISGRILVENPGGRLLEFRYDAKDLPDELLLTSWNWAASWGSVKIGESSYLLPVTAELIYSTAFGPFGRMGRVTREYKNHRHFEASETITYP